MEFENLPIAGISEFTQITRFLDEAEKEQNSLRANEELIQEKCVNARGQFEAYLASISDDPKMEQKKSQLTHGFSMS